MKRLKRLLLNIYRKSEERNVDKAEIRIGDLVMKLDKSYAYDKPHEISIIVPRVEIREKIETPFFKKTKETIYNGVTIVDAPKAPLSGENNLKIIPPKKDDNKSSDEENKPKINL